MFQKEKVTRLEQQSVALQTKIIELQKSPFACAKQNDVLEESYVVMQSYVQIQVPELSLKDLAFLITKLNLTLKKILYYPNG